MEDSTLLKRFLATRDEQAPWRSRHSHSGQLPLSPTPLLGRADEVIE